MKIREFITNVPDMHGVLDWSGDGLLLAAVKSGVDGAREFAGIFDELRKKGFSQRESVAGALDGAEHLLNLSNRTLVKHAVDAAKVARDLAEDVWQKRQGILPPKSEAFVPIKVPTFEDSLSDHEKKCPVCREQALKKWNEKGAK